MLALNLGLLNPAFLPLIVAALTFKFFPLCSTIYPHVFPNGCLSHVSHPSIPALCLYFHTSFPFPLLTEPTSLFPFILGDLRLPISLTPVVFSLSVTYLLFPLRIDA